MIQCVMPLALCLQEASEALQRFRLYYNKVTYCTTPNVGQQLIKSSNHRCSSGDKPKGCLQQWAQGFYFVKYREVTGSKNN